MLDTIHFVQHRSQFLLCTQQYDYRSTLQILEELLNYKKFKLLYLGLNDMDLKQVIYVKTYMKKNPF